MFKEAEVRLLEKYFSAGNKKKKIKKKASMQQRDANTFEVGATWAEKNREKGLWCFISLKRMHRADQTNEHGARYSYPHIRHVQHDETGTPRWLQKSWFCHHDDDSRCSVFQLKTPTRSS